jgi:chromate transporter
LKKKKNIYLELFLSTLKLSACTFGGGFVIVPLMRKRFVEELHWIDEQEMIDLVSVSQSSPGPIAVNASLMVGYRIGGFFGAMTTAIGTILPPLIIISVISFFYKQFRDNEYVSAAMKGMQAGVAVVICNVVIDMGRSVLKNKNILAGIIMAGVFISVYFLEINIIIVIIACAIIGLVSGIVRNRCNKKAKE